VAKKQGLYSDLDEFIEEGGRHDVEKDVEQEGNIPSSNPKPESPKREGNIQPPPGENPEESARRIQRQESATPEGPESKGNIEPREGAAPESSGRQSIDPKKNPPETPESQSIPVSDQAPEKPQRRGNIEPRQFDPKKGQVQRDANEGSKPETPRRKENIRPDQSNRPDNPNRISRQPNEEAAPNESNQRSLKPKTKSRPEEPNQGSRQGKDEATSNKVNQKSREARSGATPSGPNQNQRKPKTGATPQSPPQSQREAREKSRPQDPQRRVINLREAAAPAGSNQRGNIRPSEEPPTTEPTEGTDIDVNTENRPPQNNQTGNINSKDRRPDSPQRENNIGVSENAAPQEANQTDNIPSREEASPQEPNRSEIHAEENKPKSPQRDGNISPKDENGPSGTNQSENINPTEESEPEAPSRENNISSKEESRPSQTDSDGAISPTEESESTAPSRQENINPTEGSEPESPNQSENISPIEDSEPEAPSRNENISPPEEPQPPFPQAQGNIPSREEPQPEAPRRSENIQPTEESEPQAPSDSDNIVPPEKPQPPSVQSGNKISPTEESEPSSPQVEENISPTEESEPESPNRLENINPPEEPQPEEPNRESAIDPTENSEPSEPSRQDSIFPTEESEPEGPSKRGNINPPEEPQLPEPDSGGAISPTEESEPSEPQKESNIPSTEKSESESPNQDGFISPTEESEPDEPDQDSYISPTKEPQPQEPQKEGNIDPSDEEVADDTGDQPLQEPQREGNIDPTEAENTDGVGGEELSDPQREGNIDPSDKSVTEGTGDESLSEPRREGNIDPTKAENTDGIGGEKLKEPKKQGNIDPADSENTDGIGGEEIEREQPLKFQPARFSSQIDPENVDFVDTVAGSEDAAPEWQPPLRYQPQNYASQIDPSDEGGRYQLERFVAGSNEPGDNVRNMTYDDTGVSEALRFQNVVSEALDSGTIDPSFEGGIYSLSEFVAGSNEPGDNVRDMDYDQDGASEELHHQPENIQQKLRSGTIINPDDEGGRYQLEQFVVGSDEPGGDVRDMRYDNSGVAEELRFQRVVDSSLDNGIIDPEFEGGQYMSENFVAGSSEPGDNVRNMEYDAGGANENLRHQPENIQQKLQGGTVIDPSDEGGRYISKNFVAGPDEPGDDIRDMGYNFAQADAPLRHQPEEIRQKLRDGGVIDSSDEGGRYQLEQFVAGSNEPGDNIRDMAYDNEGAIEELRFQKLVNQALESGTIDPSFEGGFYSLPEFVTGSDEPGGDIRDMAYDQDGANEELRHQPQNIQQKLRGGTIINPDEEGGRYQLDQFVAGSDEPGDDIRDMEYGVEGANEVPRHQPENIRQKLRSNAIINPDDEGGRYQLEDFVAGSDEPGDNILEMPESEPYEWPMDFQSDRFKGEIDPENAEFTNEVGGSFSSSENATPEWEEAKKRQTRFQDEIDPNNPDTTDGVGGSFPSSENATIEANETEEFQTRFQGEIEDLNRTVRLSQFDSLFGDGRTDLPVGDSPIPRAEFTQASVGPDQPFILRRPEAGGGSAVIANAKQADSRTAPIGSAAEDTVRISKFFATGKGITYNVKQQFLQSQNPRTRTRIYDPTSPIQTSASGMAVRPGQQITRHISADSGPLGLVGDAASAIGDIAGFNVPQSSRYEDELEEEAVDTEWGEMQGSLFWLSPVAQRALPEVTGEGARTRINQIRSGNVQNIKPLFSTSEQDQLSQFAAAALGRQGGIGNGYLFTNSYDPQGGPQGEGREETDNYHPSVPYVRNIDSMNSRRQPTGSAYVSPEFSSPGEQLRALTTAARNAKDSVFPFINSNATPNTDDITDGRGNVITQRQNDTTSEVYYENRVIGRGGDRIPVHRGVQQKENHGLPNYSKRNEDGEKINRIDWINRLEPIVGKGADPEQETFGEGQHKDFIPFKFYDVENEGLIVFRAFLEGISDNLSPEWSQQDYAGRPEQGHIYGGYSNTISFSFQVAPFSKEEFKAQWKKINYLKGLTTPSGYSFSAGAGTYMTPPFMRMTIGDMFNDVYGYMNSLTISVNDDMDWEIDQDVGRLPRGIEVDVDWQVIEKRAPLALQKFYDAPFIDGIEEPTRESPEPREEVLPKSADDAVEKPGIDTNRAINQSTESDSSGGDAPVNPEDTTPFTDIPNFTP